jgi:hypothetical protein
LGLLWFGFAFCNFAFGIKFCKIYIKCGEAVLICLMRKRISMNVIGRLYWIVWIEAQQKGPDLDPPRHSIYLHHRSGYFHSVWLVDRL